MRKLLSLTLFIALAIAACSPGDEGGEATTTADDGTSTTRAPVEATTTTEAAPITTTTVGMTTTTGAPTAAGGPSCIEGDWLFGSEGFVEAMRSLMTEQELQGADVSALDGTYTISFGGDGSFTAVRDEWGFAVETPDGTVSIIMSGEETGTWSADDSTISVSVSSSDTQVTAQVESDGETFTLPSSPVEVPVAITESSPYQCDSDTLTVTTEEVTFELERA